MCPFCTRYARAECHSLVEALGGTPVDIVASGGRDVHVYYEDDGGMRDRAVTLSRNGAVRLDENVTASLKSTVALPGSLHAGSMQPVVSLMKEREVTSCW